VEDKNHSRGPKAVQLSISFMSRSDNSGARAQQARKASEAETKEPKSRNNSTSSESSIAKSDVSPVWDTSVSQMSSSGTIEIVAEDVSSTTELTPAILTTPASCGQPVNPLDDRYFYFFLSSMPYVLPYARLFPSVVDNIFARSVMHITLRHSVLSISSMVADYRLQRSMDRFHNQYITSLHMIQNSIQEMDIDEGTTIAVFLVLWIDVVRAELRSSRKHLRGLYLLLQELQKKYRPPEDTTQGMMVDKSGGVGVSPLIMQIWRIAIRLDFTTSLYLVQPPVFPLIPPEQQDLHVKWIAISTPDGDTAEWALAAFAMDNLMHRACHLATQARSLRNSPGYVPEMEVQILAAANVLLAQIDEWHNRPIVQHAKRLEEEQFKCSTSDSSPSSVDEELWTFLDHPPRRILNHFYGNLEISSLATAIYISFITYPDIGPAPYPQRFLDAVEICQIMAGLGEDTPHTASSKIWIVFVAGAALGGVRSKRESEWLLWRMKKILAMFPLMKDAITTYPRLWDTEGDFWDEMDKVQALLYQ
jgi:hypothetical protein